MSRFILIKQHDQKDCGATCLAMVCKYYGYEASISKFREYTKTDNRGTNIYSIVKAARELGLEAEALEGDFDELREGFKQQEIHIPFIAHIVTETGFAHFVVVNRLTDKNVIVSDPAVGILKYSVEEFNQLWTGGIISFIRSNRFVNAKASNYLTKIMRKAIWQHRKKLGVIVFTSLFIIFTGIIGTYIFRIIIDYATTGLRYNIGGSDIAFFQMLEEGWVKNIAGALHRWGNSTLFSLNYVDIICMAVIALYILGAFIQLVRGRMLAKFTQQVDMNIMLEYYEHTLSLPLSFFGTRKTGEILSRYGDAVSIRDAISNGTLTALLDSIMLIVGYVVLLGISPKLTIAATAVLTMYVLIILLFKNKIQNINKKTREEDAQIMSFFKEGIDGIETIKVFQQEEQVKGKGKDLFQKMLASVFNGNMLKVYQGTLVGHMSLIGTIILLWIGMRGVISSDLTIGEVIAFTALTSYILNPIQNLVNLQPLIQTAAVAADRLGDILLVEKENLRYGQKSQSLQRTIEFKNVDFRYGNGELILNNCSFQVDKGKRVALVGESGSGKTTIAKLLMAFYDIEKGKIFFDERVLGNLSKEDVRGKIAYVSQDVFFFTDTILNNLRLGNPDATPEAIKKVCKMSMADEFLMDLPMGIQTVLDENGTNLSSGQRQRLAIARALLKNPDILILDEATSNLDSVTELAIAHMIEGLNENMTCIIIAHRLSTIKNCDEIFVLSKGRVVERGTHQMLLDQQGQYYSFWASSSQGEI